MFTKTLIPALSGLAAASAQAVAQVQAPAPSEVLLTSTMSGVLPVAPTPFAGVETIEGAITYDGNPIPGFVGPGGQAEIQNDNPQTAYIATLPTKQFDPYVGSTIQGSIIGKAATNGTGVMFTVSFTGLPSEDAYGPFVYHIHNLPLSPDGNCTTSKGHLDPTNRGELHACDDTQPSSCQVGDLAGKHGNITSTNFQASYTDLYLSTVQVSDYFFGDKSVVVHSANTTRLTCANFTMMAAGSNPTATAGAGTAAATAAATGGFTGAAVGLIEGGVGVVFGVGAVLVSFLL